MTKLKLRFMLIVLRFVYDWYVENGMDNYDNVDDLHYLITDCEEKLEEE